MRYANRTTRLGGQAADAWVVHDLAVERLRRGDDIILLSIGDPDFDTPAPIVAAAVQALATGRTHYAPVDGEPALREAIAGRAGAVLGFAVPSDQVVVFPGAQAALFALAQCLFEDGDEVIVPEPAYVTYEGLLGAAGAVMRLVPLRPERRIRLDASDVAGAITPRTRGLLLKFPHNPTGALLGPDEAAGIAGLCHRHDLMLISDEVYAALTFGDGPHRSPASLPGMRARTAVVSSLSKSHAMTGWRCGWTITSEALAGHLRAVARCMYFGMAPFVQDAAIVALRDAGAETARLRDEYRSRARLVTERLAAVPGMHCPLPEAGMYVFADVRETGMSGTRFARELLEAAGVAVTPGEGFGPSGAGHVRITLGVDEARLVEACERIAAFARQLQPPVVPVTLRR
jgi:arginine:pyruvate transaminase